MRDLFLVSQPALSRCCQTHSCDGITVPFEIINILFDLKCHAAESRSNSTKKERGPSSGCPTETFLLSKVINRNYQRTAEPPTDINS